MRIIIVFLLMFFSLNAVAQSDGNYEYTREFIWGVNKNTRGGLIGGFVFKWSKALDEKKFRTIGFEMMNVKNPDEIRLSTGFGQFIPHKTYYLYAIRSQYGRDHILFRKTPSKGVQVNFNYAVGPTLGIIAPYYVTDTEDKRRHYTEENFPSLNNIVGTGFLFQGLGESDFTVGLNWKASLTFETGAFKSNVTGFEIGTLMEIYPQEIELLTVGDNNTNFFPTLFITFFYGKRR